MGGSPVLKPDQRSDQLVDQTPTQRHTCSFHPVPPFDSSRNSVIGAEPGMAGADTHHSRLERPSLRHSGEMFTGAKDTLPFHRIRPHRMNGNGLGQRPAAYCLLPTGSLPYSPLIVDFCIGNGEWAATSPTSGRSCPPSSSDRFHLFFGSIPYYRRSTSRGSAPWCRMICHIRRTFWHSLFRQTI